MVASLPLVEPVLVKDVNTIFVFNWMYHPTDFSFTLDASPAFEWKLNKGAGVFPLDRSCGQ
jgi:hypothetical protein